MKLDRQGDKNLVKDNENLSKSREIDQIDVLFCDCFGAVQDSVRLHADHRRGRGGLRSQLLLLSIILDVIFSSIPTFILPRSGL